MLVGYARVSSAQQNLDRQLGTLRAQRCARIFAEKVSGKSLKGRPELEKAIDELGTGDVLMLAEWDRATRSMMDGIAIMQRVHARGAAVKVLDKPHLDLTTPIGRGLKRTATLKPTEAKNIAWMWGFCRGPKGGCNPSTLSGPPSDLNPEPNSTSFLDSRHTDRQ